MKGRGVMNMEITRNRPLTEDEINAVGEELYNELAKTESQPVHTMRSADEVFKELNEKYFKNKTL
jgi:transcriptional regulator NrdR family protein